eukprot:m.222012 g.222012  ORF g.222012 m.222012 type:complete len:333 (+) comp10693_c0_seq1:44-1042(+)
MAEGKKVVDLITEFQAANPGKPFFSVEFFPPKTDDGVKNLESRFDRFQKLGPLFADMTWGAGGSTSDLTLNLCLKMQNSHHLQANMHLTCTNMERSKLDIALEGAKAGNVRNILALRGDPPAGKEWTACEGGFECALDLVAHIRKNYGDFFGIGVAGYPEGHISVIKPVADVEKLTASELTRLVTLPEGVFVCSDEDYAKEIAYLKSKVDAGADVIITQMIFEAEVYGVFVKDCRAAGIHVPILPGIMCISNYGGFNRMTSLCKSRFPAELKAALDAVKDDDNGVREVGISEGVKLCKRLVELGAPGLHLYTLNLDKVSVGMIQGLGFGQSA